MRRGRLVAGALVFAHARGEPVEEGGGGYKRRRSGGGGRALAAALKICVAN